MIGALIQSTAEDAFRSPALVACMLLLFTLPMVVGLAVAAVGYLWVAVRRADPPSGDGNPSI